MYVHHSLFNSCMQIRMIWDGVILKKAQQPEILEDALPAVLLAKETHLAGHGPTLIQSLIQISQQTH